MKMASKENKKYALAILNSSDLSLGFHCNFSQTRDTIPLTKDGIVRHSSSLWASPVYLVKKNDESWRPCPDYGQLNWATVPDAYPHPIYWILLPLLPQKTSLRTLFGLFKFTRLLFGIRNMGNTFQRMMDCVLAGLDFIFVFLNGSIIIVRSQSEHLAHLQLLFEQLK
jgi:hypothetical protein